MSLCNVFRPGHQKGGFGIEEILLFLLLISASSQYDFGGRDFCPNNVARMLRVGVVFTEDDVEAGRAKAYQTAVDLINEGQLRNFPHDFYNEKHPVCVSLGNIIVSNKSSSFRLSKSLCHGLEAKGYHVIMGPSSAELGFHVRSICNAMDIPHISTAPNNEQGAAKNNAAGFSINLYPNLKHLHESIVDLLGYLSSNYTQDGDEDNKRRRRKEPVGIVFTAGRATAALGLQEVLLSNGIDCIVRVFSKEDGLTLTRELKQKDIHTVLMDIGSSKDIQDFFAACRDVGFFGEDRRFVLVSLSFNAFNIADEGQQQQQQPNIVSNGDKFSKSFVFLRLVDPSNPIAKAISEKLRPRTNIRKRDEDPPIREFEVDDALRRKKNSRILMDYSDNLRPTLEDLELESALVYDGLTALIETADALNDNFLVLGEGNDVSCEREKPWALGSTFFNFLNAVESDGGVTGVISFKVRDARVDDHHHLSVMYEKMLINYCA